MRRALKATMVNKMVAIRLETDSSGKVHVSEVGLKPNAVAMNVGVEKEVDGESVVVYLPGRLLIIDYRNIHKCKVYNASYYDEDGVRYISIEGEAEESLSKGYINIKGTGWSLHEVLLIPYLNCIKTDDQSKMDLGQWMNDRTVSVYINHKNSNTKTHDVSLLEVCTVIENNWHGQKTENIKKKFHILREYGLLPCGFEKHYRYLGFSACNEHSIEWFDSTFLVAVKSHDWSGLIMACLINHLFEIVKEELTEDYIDTGKIKLDGRCKHTYNKFIDESERPDLRLKALSKYKGENKKMVNKLMDTNTEDEARDILLNLTIDEIRKTLRGLAILNVKLSNSPSETFDTNKYIKSLDLQRYCVSMLEDRGAKTIDQIQAELNEQAKPILEAQKAKEEKERAARIAREEECKAKKAREKAERREKRLAAQAAKKAAQQAKERAKQATQAAQQVVSDSLEETPSEGSNK